ncbi:thioredoxin domain-containing protein [Chitinophaga sp. SYP-B3965]|uniref:cysteine peptidase family C39 domain-containing protein n=1 Tax=Chitinophaga sp. SYP-B3965 TaxID=2663120 RepID=UPI0012995CBB|nr:cysteine peptidase family C39 domain-containing protein [Chitinophaga sp. SYP-B3965]MRG46986.1 thioredoxin domain-containing protein [Chitinophaga sp. SYP-B3965]
MLLTIRPRPVNAVAVLTMLIKKLNVPVSPFTISDELQDHPAYPSLLALSDCLSSWKVPHETYRIDKRNYDTAGLAYPFIAHLETGRGQFILVHEIINGEVRYSNEKKEKNTITEADFLERWDGVILYAEKDIQSGEHAYKSALIKGWVSYLRLPVLLFLLLAFALTFINYISISVPLLGLLGLKLAGIIVSALLLLYTLDANNPFIQNICNAGGKNGCNAILRSDAAKVTSWLSWSEVGAFYFIGSFACLLLNPGTITLLAWLNIVCIPYTFYSIWYQVKKRSWCTLCSSIQVLLWLEAVFFIAAGAFYPQTSDFLFTPAVIVRSILCFFLPVAIWGFLKPILRKSEEIEPIKKQLRKFKYDSALFNQLLAAQPHHTLPDSLMPVILGNPVAENIITVVSNPLCNPCAETHKLLDEWLSTMDGFQLKIIFSTSGQDDDIGFKVAQHITSLSLSEDKGIVEKALHDWYVQSDKEYEKWAQKYPVQFNEDIKDLANKQNAWCGNAGIFFTPSILVNGHELMEPYRLEDIKYLLSY